MEPSPVLLPMVLRVMDHLQSCSTRFQRVMDPSPALFPMVQLTKLHPGNYSGPPQPCLDQSAPSRTSAHLPDPERDPNRRPRSRAQPEANPSPAEQGGAGPGRWQQWRGAPPCPARGSHAHQRSRAEPSGAEASRSGPERIGAVRLGARGPARGSAMRRGRGLLRVLALPLLLLGPAPGWGGGCCPPCPPSFGVTEPCDHAVTHCPPCAHGEELEHAEEEPGTGVPSSITPESVAPSPEAGGRDIIPVYCSLLAAVVVGLLAYVAFKCCHTCRQKRQLAKARAGDAGTSPEGEKLHSDSGVFLDTHSLQETQQLGKAPRPEGHVLSTVPAQRQEELERLLESGGPGGDWRSLAAHLGFGPDAIDAFGRGRAPARALLSAWAGAEGATLETLCQALAAIGRHDDARRLAGPGDAATAAV
ncbi:uncharacterized protein LOC142361107 [Opisthocomus hoazin]|uniref:uncharacterized protein LOC142361107 n=1 Tax=Opisthocomus hoazin TaxID=30419 RepID=UPI003F52EC77